MENGTRTPTSIPEAKKRKKALASCVYFSPEEHALIMAASRTTGQTVPQLLRQAFFSGKPVSVLMTQEERERCIRELKSWGNNLNQLARRVNAGIMKGWQVEFDSVRWAIRNIEHRLVRIYGDR